MNPFREPKNPFREVIRKDEDVYDTAVEYCSEKSAVVGAKAGIVLGEIPILSAVAPFASVAGAVAGSVAGEAFGMAVGSVLVAVANTASAKEYAEEQGRAGTYQFGDGVNGGLASARKACEGYQFGDFTRTLIGQPRKETAKDARAEESTSAS